VIRLELADAYRRRNTTGGKKDPINAVPVAQPNRDGSH
jgi:hypothetical protein